MPKLNILLTGMVAAVPRQGGATWAVLQYLLGLKQLGHQVHFLEPVSPDSVTPARAPFHDSSNVAYFLRVCDAFGLGGTATLLNTGTGETAGAPYEDLQAFARKSDLLINISGVLRDQGLVENIPLRVYLDLDPAFTQLWHEVQGVDVGFEGHTHFVTIGMAAGMRECRMPTCGLTWITTLQPVVLSHWPVVQRVVHDGLTTIANWRGYGSIEWEGRNYAQKAHSLRPFFSLPERTNERFMLALSIHPGECDDLENLHRRGWQLIDPRSVAGSPERFQRFVQGSKAEFGLAKSGYVLSRCGWFSDRSVCYLASGRPVLAQETGFSDFLPAGDGLLAWDSEDAVLDGIDRLNGNYAHHCASAREVAEDCFESSKILNALLGRIGAI